MSECEHRNFITAFMSDILVCYKCQKPKALVELEEKYEALKKDYDEALEEIKALKGDFGRQFETDDVEDLINDK